MIHCSHPTWTGAVRCGPGDTTYDLLQRVTKGEEGRMHAALAVVSIGAVSDEQSVLSLLYLESSMV